MAMKKSKKSIKVGIWVLGCAGNNMHVKDISHFPDEFETWK